MLDVAELEPIRAAMAASSLDSIVVIDETGRVLGLNPAAESMFGYSQKEALGVAIADLIVPESARAAHTCGLAAYVAGGPAKVIGRRIETTGLRKDGSLVPIELTVLEVVVEGRRVFTATIRDRSLNVAQEAELEDTRRQLELAVAGAKLGVWTFDPSTGSVWYSDRSREIYGLARDVPLDARTLKARIHPDDWQRLAAPYYDGFPDEALEIEYRVVRPDGEVRWIYALGAPDRCESAGRRVHGIHIDVTDRKRAEEELGRSRDALHQTEKLAALGTLLAGVSHELNNPLAAIVGQAEMLEEDSRGTPIEARARRIGAAAERCAKIVQTFLAMARQRDPQRGPVNVNELIAAALEITEYALRTAGISVRVTFGSSLPQIDGDRDQLHQVLVNLIVNAQQAMEKGQAFEKVLSVRTSVSQAGRVLIDISDTGPGIPADLRSRIFDPFFSTKAQTQGGGTGIGLSFSQGIIEAHGGSLSVEPARRGAHFRIDLPAPAMAMVIAPRDDQPISAESAASGGRRVLLVEDEPDVAETLRELLERDGFEVTVASDGTQAFFALDKGDFDLLFSDLRMPLLNGQQLYERLLEIRPQLVEHMAFVTGDTVGDSMGDFLKTCGRPILEKPFTKAGVRAVLAAIAMPESDA